MRSRNGTIGTATLWVWLRRVGGQAGRNGLEHQEAPGIRGLLWVDNPAEYTLTGPSAHLALPIAPEQWQPSLQLQFLEGGTEPRTVNATFEMEYLREPRFTGPLRPLSFHFDLPKGDVGDCFKVRELSFPRQRVNFCLHAHPHVCPLLAPPARHTKETPALWTAFGPLRDYESTRTGRWEPFYHRTAILIYNYLSYHLAVGVSGALVYADALARTRLAAQPLLSAFVTTGALRFVQWDLPEREEKYNYDQALVNSHALLALSPCGANLAVLLTDLDEFLYFPGQQPWPAPITTCVPSQQHPGGIAQLGLRRFNVLVSKLNGSEQALWTRPPTSPSILAHPLNSYDLIFKEPIQRMHSKRIVFPAQEVVGWFVHEGWSRHGAEAWAEPSCVSVIHVKNLMSTRMVIINETLLRPWRLELPESALEGWRTAPAVRRVALEAERGGGAGTQSRQLRG